MVVYKKMAVAAEPSQVCQLIIFTILIEMMHDEHTFLLCSTKSTSSERPASYDGSFIGILPMFPIRMFFPDKYFRAPLQVASSTAKKLLRSN